MWQQLLHVWKLGHKCVIPNPATALKIDSLASVKNLKWWLERDTIKINSGNRKAGRE